MTSGQKAGQLVADENTSLKGRNRLLCQSREPVFLTENVRDETEGAMRERRGRKGGGGGGGEYGRKSVSLLSPLLVPVHC